MPTPLNETIAALIRGIEAVVGTTDGTSSELERRYANTRAAMARARPRRADRLAAASTPASRARHVHLRLPDRPPLRLRGAAGRRRAVRSSSRPRRATSASTARPTIEQVFADRPGRGDRGAREGAGWKRIGVYGLDYIMTVRDYARSRASTSSTSTSSSTTRAPSRATAELESVRDRCASTSAASRSSSSTTRRARRRRGDGGRRGLLRRAGLRAATDGHGADGAGRTGSRCPSSRSRARTRSWATSAAVARGRGPGRALGRGLARRRHADAALSDHTKRQMEAYSEYFEAARSALRAGRDVPRRAPRGLEGLHRARLPPRPRDRATRSA